jgi:hypothetical protein
MYWTIALAFLLGSTQTPSAVTGEPLVRKFYGDFNSHNAEALVSHVAENVRWMTITGEAIAVEVAGRDALRTSMTRYFRGLPTVQSRIESLMVAGDFVTVHERVTWRAGTAEKTQSALAVYKLKGPEILAVWYYDVMP